MDQQIPPLSQGHSLNQVKLDLKLWSKPWLVNLPKSWSKQPDAGQPAIASNEWEWVGHP